jgi:hypothetical protein
MFIIFCHRLGGQQPGDGGYSNHDDGDVAKKVSTQRTTQNELGSLKGWLQNILNSQENFLNGLLPWYLYFWEIVDLFQLL